MEEKIDRLIRLVNQLGDRMEDLAQDVKSIKESIKNLTESGISSAVKPSNVEWEQKHGDKTEADESSTRIKCPKCGAVGKDIGKKEDKSKIITYIGGVPQYGVKYYCKKCMYEWSG